MVGKASGAGGEAKYRVPTFYFIYGLNKLTYKFTKIAIFLIATVNYSKTIVDFRKLAPCPGSMKH